MNVSNKLKRELVSETTLSRVRSHFMGDRAVGIITAFRGDKSYSENVRRNKELASLIRKNGYGYVYIDGHWVEKDGNNVNDTSEDSILVIGNENDGGRLRGLIRKWVVKYNQDAAIIKDSESTDVELIFQSGESQKLGKFKPQAIAQAYTRLRGRGGQTFVFEDVTRVEKNWLGKIADSKK